MSSFFDLSAWPLEDALEYLRERGYAYTVKETKPPRAKVENLVYAKYVAKQGVDGVGVYELLICYKEVPSEL